MGSYAPTTLADWLAQTQAFIAALLPQVDAGGNALAGEDLARTVENGVVIGGVRVSQRRAAAAACPHGAYFGGAFAAGRRCAALSGEAGGFEDGVDGLNLSDVAAAGFAAEFARTPLAFDTSGAAASSLALALAAGGGGAGGAGAAAGAAASARGPEFHHFASAFAPSAESSAALAELVSWGWVDRRTLQLVVGASVLFPDLGYVAQLSLSAAPTRGGRLAAAQELRSMSLDPYADAPGLAALDLLVLLYLIYLGAGALKRAARLCCIGKGAARAARLRALLSVSTALDWATIAALAAAIAAWAAYYGELQAARALLRALPSGAPALAAEGPADGNATATAPEGNSSDTGGAGGAGGALDDAGAGAGAGAAPAAFPPDWAFVHLAFSAASAALGVFKTAAVWALILLSCRLFKYVAFQSRLSVFADALWAGREDLVHFGLLFGLLCVAFGYWAYFAFGTQDNYLSSAGAGGAPLGFMRMMMWDYQ